MYVYSGQPVRHESVLERDLLAQSADLLETALADHAVRGVLRGIHQAVRVDDPSVRQHHGGPYDYLGANLFDIHNGNHGSSREFRYDDRIRLVLCVHELSGIVSGLLASLYFHPAVGQLYRIGQGKGINPKKLRY